MATRGPQSVLDRRRSDDYDRIIADRITRHKSPGRSPKKSPRQEDVEVVPRIPQPYRTSFSAVTLPSRTSKSERSRSISPSLKTDRSRSKSPGGRRTSPKHVTYDSHVTVRHSGTQEKIPLSDQSIEAPRNRSWESSPGDSPSEKRDMSQSDDDGDYSSRLRDLSQQIVNEYSATDSDKSSREHWDVNSVTPNGDTKGICNTYLTKDAKVIKHNVSRDYTHDRTTSYRIAVQGRCSEESKQTHPSMGEKNGAVDSRRHVTSKDSPRKERSNTVSSDTSSGNNHLSPRRRSVGGSIGNFFRRISPRLARKHKGQSSSTSSSAQSLATSDSASVGSDKERTHFSRGKIRSSFMKMIGRSKSRTKSHDQRDSQREEVVVVSPETDRTVRSEVVDENDSVRQNMPSSTSRIMKSIEKNTLSEKEVYHKFKDRHSPNRPGETTAGSKPHAVKPSYEQGIGDTAERPPSRENDAVPTQVEEKRRSAKLAPPSTLDVQRQVPKSVKALQTSVISTVSGDGSIGDCSLDASLTGSEPSIQSGTTHSVLSQRELVDPLSGAAISPIVANTPTVLVKSPNQSRTENGAFTQMPLLADTAEFSEEEYSRTPSYLKISCAVSGYAQYNRYRNIEKRSPFSSSSSIRSDLTSPDTSLLTQDRTMGQKVSSSPPKSRSTQCGSTNASSPKKATSDSASKSVMNGDAVAQLSVNGHLTELYPTGDAVKDGNYYLSITQTEEDRLLILSAKAEEHLRGRMSEDASGKIRSAVGKASLLVTKKFKQFKELCHLHISPPTDGSPPTKLEDLQGFWDMIIIQIDDVDEMFAEINTLHHNGWKEVNQSKMNSDNSSPKSGSLSQSGTGTPTSGTPSGTPGTKRKVQKVKNTPDSSPETLQKSKEAAKTRDDARKRLLAEKRAALKQQEKEVEIFISEGKKK